MKTDTCTSLDVLSWHLIWISIKTFAMTSKSIYGAANNNRGTVKDRGIDHRCFDIIMAQKTHALQGLRAFTYFCINHKPADTRFT